MRRGAGFLPRLGFAVVLAIGSVACDKKAPPSGLTSEPAAPASVAAVATAASSPTPSAAPTGSTPAAEVETLMGRLRREASSRPRVSPTADEVLAALAKVGADIPNKQQSLADTYKANYCLGGYTVDGSFALSACEYGDAAAADAGRELAKQILVRVTTRDVWSHKADTLAIVQLKADDATTARKKKLVAAFLAL